MAKANSRRLSRFASEQLLDYLSHEDQKKRTQEYLDETMQMAMSGKIKLVGKGRYQFTDDNPASSSLTAKSMLAMRLARSFGEDAPCYGELESWPQHAAFALSFYVNWHWLSDRLLKKLTLEYVPSEAELPQDDADENGGAQ